MNDIRYLLDENVDPLFRKKLLERKSELIVWRVGDPMAPPRGMSDPDILVWCEKQRFILVTNNRKSMPRHLDNHLERGRHIPGIIELNPNMRIGDMIEELLLIWEFSEANEYQDRLIYLPL